MVIAPAPARERRDADGDQPNARPAPARRGHAGAGKVSGSPTLTDPFIVVMVDELAFLAAYCPDRDFKRPAPAALSTLTSQGRSMGIRVRT
jgi:hypothetical protein